MKMYSPTPRYFSLETISGFSPALITCAVSTLVPCHVGYAVPLNPEQLVVQIWGSTLLDRGDGKPLYPGVFRWFRIGVCLSVSFFDYDPHNLPSQFNGQNNRLRIEIIYYAEHTIGSKYATLVNWTAFATIEFIFTTAFGYCSTMNI